MKIVECAQYTPEWWTARRGIPTASRMGDIITAQTMKPSVGMTRYICELVGDLADPQYPRVDDYQSAAMKNGTILEPEARAWYEMDTNQTVRQVGFILSDDGRFGCSPDGLIGDAGGLELKSPLPKTHVAYLLDGGLPDAYKAQVHASLVVTGLAWWDFVSYCPGLEPLRVRVIPDDFTEALRVCMAQFT